MLLILEILTIVSFAIFIGFYLFYVAVCLVHLRTKCGKSNSSTSKKLPTVSVIIPTYNEAQVISRKMLNINALNYPKDKLEIVFVDGGSTDGTASLIQESAKTVGFSVKIIQQGARKGFNKAVVDGFASTTSEIICITGAETEYSSDALSVMIEKLSDPKVGAVTGKQIIKNVNEGYSPKLEVAYRSLYDFLREAESCIDSPFDIKGEISAARRDVMANLVDRPGLSRKGCIDCCISFQAKMNGYRTVFAPEATYYELSPKTLRESTKQQVRRAATLIENMLEFKSMILNRKFGAFGMLIMPAHFLMLNILPFLLLVGSICMILLVILNPSNYLLLAIVGVAFLATLLSRQVQAFLKTQIILIVATLKLLTGIETQKFERLSSTRS